MPFSVYRNSQWSPAKKAWVYVNGAWQPIKKGWTYISSLGLWKLFFTSAITPTTEAQSEITLSAADATTGLRSLTGKHYHWNDINTLYYGFEKSTDNVSYTPLSSNVATNPGTGSSTTNTTSLLNNGTHVVANTTNYYRYYTKGVNSIYSTEAYSYSNNVTVEGAKNISNLTASGATSNSINLSWTAGADTSSYKVYYGTSSGNLTSTVDTGSTSITISMLSSGTTYYFAVKPYTGPIVSNAVTGYSGNLSSEVSLSTTTQPTLGEINNLKVWLYNTANGIMFYRFDSVTNATEYAWSITPASLPVTITQVISNGSTVTYTANNNFSIGQIVKVTGTGSFDTPGSVIQSVTSTSFTINKTGAPVTINVSGLGYVLNFSDSGTFQAANTSTQTVQIYYNGNNLSPETTYFFSVVAKASGYNDSPSAENIYITNKTATPPTAISSLSIVLDSVTNTYTLSTNGISGGNSTKFYLYAHKYGTAFAAPQFYKYSSGDNTVVSISGIPRGDVLDLRLYGSSIGKNNGADQDWLSPGTPFYPVSSRYVTISANSLPAYSIYNFADAFSATALNFSKSIYYSRIPSSFNTPSQLHYFATVLYKKISGSWSFQAVQLHRMDGSSLTTDLAHTTGYGNLSSFEGYFTSLTAGDYRVECRIYNNVGYSTFNFGSAEVTIT